MNILVVCRFGQSRSVYLKQYLTEKGYNAESAGIEENPESLRNKIDAADVIISVQSYIQNELKSSFDLSGKKLIALDVEDNTDQPVYTQKGLEEQIARFLPLEHP